MSTRTTKPPSSQAERQDQAPYRVLARKYRPTHFGDLIGQDAMVQTLANAFAHNRIAQAYMLTGVRGIGKTTTARLLARALNYEKKEGGGEPSLAIEDFGLHCQAIMESHHVDVLEIDAASHTSVDNIREIIGNSRYKPAMARTKVYIIDEVHMLSKGAFNALLKTLEEPPDHVKFILATTEIQKVPVTVLSRCQRFDLRRVESALLADHFKKIAALEKVEIDDAGALLIARAAEGSVRDGLSLLDQAIARGGETVFSADVRIMLGLADRTRLFDLLRAVFKGEAAKALDQLSEIYRDGAEAVQILSEMAELIHMITCLKAAGKTWGETSLSEQDRRQALVFAEELSIPVLSRAWQMLLKGLTEAAHAPDPLAAAEMLIVRMSFIADLPSPEDLIKGHKTPSRKSDKSLPQVERPASISVESPALSATGPTAAAREKEPEEHPPEPSLRALLPQALPPLENFRDVARYVSEKRDPKLKIALKDYVHLVRFQQGHIEIRLASGAPKNLANELGEKLSQWRGERWLVSISNEAGEKTLAEEAHGLLEEEKKLVRKDSLVQHIFEYFPEAEFSEINALEKDQDHKTE